MLRSCIFRERGRRGVIAPLVAICVVALLAITGLVIDGAILMVERRHAQSVADSAALAAAQDLMQLKGSAQTKASALEYADRQGYKNDVLRSTVTVNIPPVSGQYKGDANYIEVLVTYRQATHFIQIVSKTSSSQVGARAVAGAVLAKASLFGMVGLNQNRNGILVTGTGGVTINAPVFTASTSPDSLMLGGSPSAKAKSWYTNGGVSSVSWKSATTGAIIPAGGSFSPPPQALPRGMSVQDPLRNLASPPRDGLSISGAINLTNNQSGAIGPGVYNGGISVTGNSSLVLSPGLYIIDGGGVRIGNGTSTDGSYLIADKVTFFIAAGGFDLSFYSFKTVFSPPDPLPPNTALNPRNGYPGMQLFSDRSNTSPVNLISPQSGGGLTGTFYAPAAPLSFNGNGVNPCKPIQIIAGQIIINTDTPSGNAEVDVPYVGTAFANPPEIYLVE